MIDNFQELSELVNSGIALIPIIGKEKKPYAQYKGKKKLTLPDLMRAIEFYGQNTGEECNTVAIICGQISEGVVCLDIDSKHKSGFGERVYEDIKNLYPEIFNKLEIDRTPSGGMHFYYRLSIEFGGEEGFPRSCNLSSRYATEEELSVRPDLKKKCFVEFKAEGSLCQCYPSFGYTKIKRGSDFGDFLSIGILNSEEHSCLISLCGLYDEIKKEVSVKPSRARDSFYIDGETPFDQFNRSDDGSRVLEEFGWTFFKKSGKFETWKKPGKIKNEVSASFNIDKRTYAIYTTNSNLEPDCYNPSSLLCKEKFSGDWAKFGSYLSGLGFGKLKTEIEKVEIKRAIKNGLEELPANFSDEAKEEFRNAKGVSISDNPFGEFWVENIGNGGEIKYSISRDALMKVSRDLGFRVYKEKPVKIEGNLVCFVEERVFFDKLKEYIGQKNNQELMDCYEDFLQKSGKFTITRLDLLDLDLVLMSSKYISYKFFRNCYIIITKDGVGIFSYDDMEAGKLIWEHDKKNRDFYLDETSVVKNGLYFNFVKNAIGWSEYLMKCIGFYAHDYRDEEGYMMITTEKSDNEKDGGRCGKNIFWKLFSLTTTFKSTAASMIKKDNQLLQSWNGERVFCLSDMPKKFDLIFFKDMITDGAVIRKLYKDEFVVSVHDMAKIGGSSNYTFDDSDPGVKGRLRLVEFTKYYKEKGGVKEATGKMFPKDWSEEDYSNFDNVMTMCIQEYLIANCVIEEQKISDTGWNRKFEGMYHHLYNFIKDNIDDWVLLGRVKNVDFNDSYRIFRMDSNINKPLTSFTINKALTDYCENFGIALVVNYRKKNGEMSDGVTWTENSTTIRGRYFGVEAEKFLSGKATIEIGEKVGDLPF